MALYMIIAAALFGMSAGLTFITKAVPQVLTLILAGLFPVIYLACRLPLSDMTTHIVAGAIVFSLGFVDFALGKRLLGGGVWKALSLAALWLPLGALVNFAAIAGLAGGAYGVAAYMFTEDVNAELTRFAAMVFAVGAYTAFSYQGHGMSYFDAPKAERVETSPVQDAPTLTLRGSRP